MTRERITSPKSQARFVRSVHAELDYEKAGALDGYLLTAGSRRVLGRVLPSLSDGSLPRAWTLTGPYGSGKSAFAVFASQLLAAKSFPGQQQAREILRQGDEGLFDRLPPFGKKFHGLHPIVVTGSREPLPAALLRGLARAVTSCGSRSKHGLQRKIERLQQTAAAENVGGDRDFLNVLNEAATAITADDGGPSGLFFVIDELGKLLEFAAAHPTLSDIYALQHLQEMAARSSVPILILTILHKDFIGYADRLSTHERAEWDKVRGRFEDIVFEEPADEVLRLVALARAGAVAATGLKPTPSEQKALEQLANQAWKLDLAPAGMSKPEMVSLLCECWPLHPLVALLAGPVFRKLAQNERSVFSFLASEEPHGLHDFLNQHEHRRGRLYTIDRFYDYLWTSLGEGLFSHRNGKKWAEIEGALERVPEVSCCAHSVLKAVGLMSIAGLARNVRATPEIVMFSLSSVASPADVAAAANDLKKASVIVTREYSGAYGLWEGSDVDIDDRVKVARDRLNQLEPLASLASKYVLLRPLVARAHAHKTGTLRYFRPQFVEAKDLAGELVKRDVADGRILIPLPQNSEDNAVIKRVVKSDVAAKNGRALVAVPANVRSLDLYVRELAAMEWVRDNTPELAGDPVARRELRARMAELRQQLDALTDNLLAPSSSAEGGCVWFHLGQAQELRSRRALNDYLSTCLDHVYHRTPHLLNELVNRRELSSAAAAARRNLLELMITKSNQPELGITGYPPEKSIYLSVLAQHGIHAERAEGWTFGPPADKANAGVRAVWDAIQTFFGSAERTTRNLDDLFAILHDEPFGMRDGPIPLFLCAALIASDSDVALYENGSFVPQLTVTVFERLVKMPSAYTVRKWRITGVRASVFRQLAEMLGRNLGPLSITKGNVLGVVRPLLRFVEQLPEFSQTTDQLSDQAKRVRSALKGATEADQLLFVQLPQACGFDAIEADSTVSDRRLDSFLTELRRSLGELQRHYETQLSSLAGALASAFGIADRRALRPTLTERAAALQRWVADPALRNFVARVTGTEADEQAWLESVVALLSERPPRAWRDADRAKFEVSVTRTARLFRNVESLAFASNGRGQTTSDAVRIGITTKEAGDVERVVRVRPDDRQRLKEIEDRLRAALGEAAADGQGDLALAALARVAKRLLAEGQA